MSYESYLCNLAHCINQQAEDMSYENMYLAGGLWEIAELIWNKAMRAAAHGA